MDFRLLIARRYLVSRRRVTLVSVISGLSVAGVTVGVAALVIVLSVMNGFFEVVRDLLVSYDPHVRVEAAEGGGLSGADALAAQIRQEPGVVSVSPYVEGKALLSTPAGGTLNQSVVVRGVTPEALDARVQRAVVNGAFDLGRAGGDAPGLVMGAALAVRTGVTVASPPGAPVVLGGSRVTLLSASALEHALTMYPFGLPDERAFTVRGTFALEPGYDESHVFVGLPEAQRLFRTGARVSGLDVRLADVDDAGAVRDRLERRLGAAVRVRTWYDLQGSLYGVMRLEKWAASVLLSFIIVVAAFNIIGALTMIVIEKRRDLGALMAMGARRADVRRIFLLEGLLVGVIGTGLGLAIGLGVAWLQAATGLVRLSGAGEFVIDAYPVSVRPLDVVVIACVAVGLCALAAVAPAARAASIDPARAVQSGA